MADKLIYGCTPVHAQLPVSYKCGVVEMARLSISSSLILTLGVLELVAPRACLSANVSFPIVLGESMCHTFKRRFMFTHVLCLQLPVQ